MQDAITRTRQGEVRGAKEEGIWVFKGLPFAAAPVGQLRFCPPQPPRPWEGVRDATSYGPACPQPATPELALLAADLGEMSEDCLYLNVWTPGLDGPARPVMVWIHGGAFIIGAGSQTWYQGHTLARRGDVVVVTFNYRLGALGFLDLDAATGGALNQSGNAGLLDQVAALEWVRDNIAAFGGDPNEIMVFGESAGAMSVATLCGTPRAQGLFHKAAAQSGAAEMVRGKEEAASIALSFLTQLDLSQGRSINATDLQALPIADLVAAQERFLASLSALGADQGGRLAFCPVVDGDVLPEEPLVAVRRGSARGVPLLIGTNLDEMKLFSLLEPRYASMTDDLLLQLAAEVVGNPEVVSKLVEEYRSASSQGREVEASEVWWALSSDWVFRIPAVRMAEAQLPHNGGQVWSYLFTWPSPLFDGALGSCHALDVPFVFGTMSDPLTAMFVGDSPEARQLAERIQDAWLAFARTGNPNADTLPEWPSYDSDRRSTMILGAACGVEDDPMGTERRVWDLLV